MHITSFRIENYKSFGTTEDVPLTPGFDVIVGQNNVGKSALVEGLSLRFGHKQHRSLRTVPKLHTPLRGSSVVSLRFCLTREDISEMLSGLGDFWVTTPEQHQGSIAAQDFAQAIRDENIVATTWQNGELATVRLEWLPPTNDSAISAQLRVTATGTVEAAREALATTSQNQRVDWQLATTIRSRIYAFDAERFRIGVSDFGTQTTLLPNAQNLPEVLANLQKNRAQFDRLIGLLQTVLPAVRGISLQPRTNHQVEILVWTIDLQTERVDLAVPLSESGTGVAQVLAVLYVVLTAESSRVILIDEPQSFLHPGAVRNLFGILKQHPQHQFIVTTHSPTAITAADPQTLLRLHIEEGETLVERLDVAEARDLRTALADVGARLSDVFGADSILWVEGLTEEMCFPKIVEGLTTRRLLGTVIVGVLHTADFDPRRSEATVELYNRLSAGRGLLPPAVGFIFDREGRSDAMRADLERRGKVHFLSRRMYENYLLNPEGISTVASAIPEFRDQPVVPEEVREWLGRNRWTAGYFDPLPAERTDAVWLSEVRGDKLLIDLFGQLSERRVEYDKVRHGVALTDWLLDHAPEDLREVAQVIERALGPRAADVPQMEARKGP